jgi:hypothetical protein
VGNSVSSEIHEFRRELHMVRKPMEQEGNISRHNNDVGQISMLGDYFTVHVSGEDNFTRSPASFLASHFGHNQVTSDCYHENTIYVNREDQLASLDDFPRMPNVNMRDGNAPMTNRFSSTKANILYNADPFGYASTSPSANRNNRRFEAHEEAVRTTMPSTANANRVDLIDTVRRKSRVTIQAIEGGSTDSSVIWVGAQVAGTAIHHATHTAGVVGMGSAAVAGNVAAAAVSAPGVIVSMAVTKLIQRLARERRLDRALSDRPQIKSQLSTTLPKARADRDIYLESVDDALMNSTKEGIVQVWDKTDKLLPRHLDNLASIGPGGDSVNQKFGRSESALTSHELKYCILAETRLLNKVKAEVRNYNA